MVMVPYLAGGCEVSVEPKHGGIGRWISFSSGFHVKCFFAGGVSNVSKKRYNPSITINNDFSWVPPENWLITSDWSEHGNKNHTHPRWSKVIKFDTKATLHWQNHVNFSAWKVKWRSPTPISLGLSWPLTKKPPNLGVAIAIAICFLGTTVSFLTSSTGAFKRCSRRSSKDSLLALRRSNCCCCRCLALRTWGGRFKGELVTGRNCMSQVLNLDFQQTSLGDIFFGGV